MREGARGAAPQGARKLVEQDDEGKTSLGFRRPVIELARGGPGRQIGKAGDDLLVRAATHPPEPLLVVAIRVHLKRATFGEPEGQDVTPFLNIASVAHLVAARYQLD